MPKILIIKMWALGDVIMATPMLNALKSANPAWHISWIVDSAHADALRGHPLIDELIVIDTVEWRKKLKKGKFVEWSRIASKYSSDLKSKAFDAVIDCHPDKWWTWLLCRAPERIGLFDHQPELAAKLFFSRTIGSIAEQDLHKTEQYLLATRSLGVSDSSLTTSVAISAVDESYVQNYLKREFGDLDQRYVLFAPFSTAENKDWPTVRYRELAKFLIEAYCVKIVLTALPGDSDRIQTLLEGLPGESVAAAMNTTVSQYMALIRGSALVVSGDSSAMHIAAAVKAPYVSLFGPTNNKDLFPVGGQGSLVRKRLDCAPCNSTLCSNPQFRKCMESIEVSDVLVAAEPFLTRRVQSR